MSRLSTLKSIVPAPAREWARHVRQYRVAATAWRDLLIAESGDRFRAVDPGEIASSEVVAKTALMKESDLTYKTKARVFLSTGMNAMADFVREAKRGGLDLAKAQGAFELGCGGARLIRHLRGVDGLELVGSDLIQDNVGWCQSNVPGITFHQNELEPPLRHAADESFDFAFAYSVFTHVPMDLQGPWISEFARILRPGGVATVTILGPDMAKKMMSPEEYCEFEALGEYTMGPEHPRVSASSARIGSWDVFMTDERMRETYEPAMDVIAHTGGAQSIVTLRKR